MKKIGKLISKLKRSFIQLVIEIGKLNLVLLEKSRDWVKKVIFKKNPSNSYRKNQPKANFLTRPLPAKREHSRKEKNWLTYLRNKKQLQGILSPRGFVLPTMTMVLLVFSLVVGSILLRTSQYSQNVITNRQDEIVYNSATPAVERAKSKLEYLFKRDDRFPNTVPSAQLLEELMENDAIYTLPGEERIDINGDGVLDNAWSYEVDLDGDETNDKELVAYSILTNNKVVEGGTTIDFNSSDQDKASKLITRTGPLSIQSKTNSADCNIPTLAPEEGWYPINRASMRKNFQVDAVVINPNAANQAIATLEFQQDRQLDRGNKWGVWFRYDLEVFPGPDFNWNGAMYTAGNVIWGQNDNENRFHAHLISSPNSCFYSQDGSEIALAQVENASGQIVFQGQVITAAPRPNDYKGTSSIDIYPGAGEAPNDPENVSQYYRVELKKETDSVDDSKQNGTSAYNYSLDPVILFTEDRSVSRNSADPSNVSIRDPNWATSQLAKRMVNKLVRKPYVDDFYRADDRWGPKPSTEFTGAQYGQLIPSTNDTQIRKDPPAGLPDQVGLDGYWERRARVQGLRVIVGQRLELGNTFGWPVGNTDPLYPSTASNHRARQRRTLRDNLAAVQATVIYHSAHNQDFPVATLATTVHNGTTVLRDNSTTFSDFRTITTPTVNTDFLTGVGTNGWEFNPPGNVTNQAAFRTIINNANHPLRIALNNLAHFAGDPDGAFPPKQESSGTIVHPYPNLTMWGNFSNLRRVMTQLNGGTDYNALSIADQTTLHTAAATLGMLAYNLNNAKKVYEDALTDSTSGMVALGQHLWQLVDGIDNPGNPEVNTLLGVPFPTGYTRATGAADFYSQFTPEQYIQALENDPSLGANKPQLIERAKMILAQNQIERDRLMGFLPSTANSAWALRTVSVGNGANTIDFKVYCPLSTFDSLFSGGGTGLDEKKLGLALAFCKGAMQPKYPSLYYLFPKNQHNQIGTGTGNTITYDDQPIEPNSDPTEQYTRDRNIFRSLATPTGFNKDYLYKVVEPVDIALQPRRPENWVLPKSTSDTGTGNKITVNGSTYYTAFLDKAFYDGRQLMQVRVLDLDLNLLRNNNIGGQSWLSNSGIIYAFREDAVREDAIARPAKSTWANCDTQSELISNTCRMIMTSTFSTKDPPVNPNTGVSTKPVDFLPDPDRRPYGFRLRNGADLSRPGTNAGISFISDNPIYLQGDFNLHRNSTGAAQEEFTDILNADNDWNNFYTRNSLNTNFAKADTDRWRPTEILGDAVTILSNNFCDGTFEDGMRNNDGSCVSGTSSYRNSDLAREGSNFWRRENSQDAPDSLKSSIRVNRDSSIEVGTLSGRTISYSTFTDTPTATPPKFVYRPLNEERTFLQQASDTEVNVVLISGLVPSRQHQSYGGLHNFPRFIERWGGEKTTDPKAKLEMKGAFFQLNFSTYATAPWEQEGWEPGNNPVANDQWNKFYNAPDRRWGYDLALQYTSASPIASRFVEVGSPRNEFYQRVAGDDPYIMQLRCATVDGVRIDPAAQCSP